MSAGAPTPDPDLDAEIAEHVMGWVRNRHGRLWPNKECFGYKHSRGHGFIPPFSTDPTAAMSVIEELSGDRFQTCLEVLTNRDGEYACTLLRPGRQKSESHVYTASAPWPARAICLAAMKVVAALPLAPRTRRSNKRTQIEKHAQEALALRDQAAAQSGQRKPAAVAARKSRPAS